MDSIPDRYVNKPKGFLETFHVVCQVTCTSRIFTCAFAHIGVVGVGPSGSCADPDPVCLVPFALDHTADVFIFKVTRIQEGGTFGCNTNIHTKVEDFDLFHSIMSEQC